MPLNSRERYAFQLPDIFVWVSVGGIASLLFFAKIDADETGYPFSEQHSIVILIEKGDNDVYIALDYPNLGEHLRLDPILGTGEVTIRSLEIKRVENAYLQE